VFEVYSRRDAAFYYSLVHNDQHQHGHI